MQRAARGGNRKAGEQGEDGARTGRGRKTGAPRSLYDRRAGRQEVRTSGWGVVQGLRGGGGGRVQPACSCLFTIPPSPLSLVTPRPSSPCPSGGSLRRATGAAATHHPSG